MTVKVDLYIPSWHAHNVLKARAPQGKTDEVKPFPSRWGGRWQIDQGRSWMNEVHEVKSWKSLQKTSFCFPRASASDRLIFEMTQKFWVSYITNINVQPASAIIWLLNLEFVFWDFLMDLCFLFGWFWGYKLSSQTWFWKCRVICLFFFLFWLGLILWFLLGNEPDVWKFSFVKNSYF